jgi:CheY-like chemotaxis protein/Zn finger protein HypA/HybF involved in hydrogenase expression
MRLIKLRIGADGSVDHGLSEAAGRFDTQEVRTLLRSLERKGFLVGEEHDRTIFCPTCDSVKAYSKYACPKCQSPKVTLMELLQHSFCGYTGEKETFMSGLNLVCPKCKMNLGGIRAPLSGEEFSFEHKIIGSSFKCEKCENKFNRPNVKHVCQECGTRFDYKKAHYDVLSEYEVLPQVSKMLRTRSERVMLIIEDNPDDVKIMKRFVKKSGVSFRVEHASTGKEGIKKLKSIDADLVVLDYYLPDMNGIDILRAIREFNANIPVVMLTGADDRQTAVEAMKLGALDYIVKGLVSYEKLPALLEKIMRE